MPALCGSPTSKRQEALWKALSGLCTPALILDLLKKGILLLGVDVPSSQSSQTSALFDTLSEAYDKVRLLARAAFVQQSNSLG